MDEEQLEQSSDSDTTQDRARAYEALVNAYYDAQQPAVTLSFAFLQANPILLEKGVLKVNWNRIPGLYTRVNPILTVVVPNDQWEKWGSPGGWTVWEPDTLATSFMPNMAVVMCKGPFHDSEDPTLRDSVCYSMAMARVPDCIPLLPFNTVHGALKDYDASECTAIGLMRYHAASRIFPDVYFHYYQQHLTIMGLENPQLVFGAADEFVAGYLHRRHQIASDQERTCYAASWISCWSRQSGTFCYFCVFRGRHRSSGPTPTHSFCIPCCTSPSASAAQAVSASENHQCQSGISMTVQYRGSSQKATGIPADRTPTRVLPCLCQSSPEIRTLAIQFRLQT